MTPSEMDMLDRVHRQLARDYPLADFTLDIATRRWSITAVRNQDALLDTVQTDVDIDNFPYGLLLWASAVGLAEWLTENAASIAGKRLLEVGAGVGFPGLVARSLGANVTQTDYQSAALNLSRINARRNGIQGITYLLADWRDFYHAERYDLVLGSDVLYERTLHYELAKLLRASVRPGGLVVLSDPLRPQAAEFTDRIEREGWQVQMESRMVTWEEDPREIALFLARAPR